MSKTLKQSKAVIVIAFMYQDNYVYTKAKNNFVKLLGEIETEGEEFNFSHSLYYEKEMGFNLKKRFLVFKKLQRRDYLIKIKKASNKIEKKYSKNDKRIINIDPGMLTLENFILSTNKNFTHRIYLKDNIFADLTLIYKKKVGYTDLPWTYLDYKDEKTILFLNNIRDNFFDRLLDTSCYK